jgi:hypothetical protein
MIVLKIIIYWLLVDILLVVTQINNLIFLNDFGFFKTREKLLFSFVDQSTALRITIFFF